MARTPKTAKGLPRSILTFMLNDTEIGVPLALMSVNLLSAYRTGAIPGVGVRYLAHPNINIEIVNELEDVVRGSDIVTFCTSSVIGDPSTYPMIQREWVKSGAFMAMPAAYNMDEAMGKSDIRKVMDFTGLYEAWYEES